LNKHVYIDSKLFTHNHPANVGRHLWDAQYERTESQDAHAKDCLNYNKRKSMLFV
jgi:hypothetical protein